MSRASYEIQTTRRNPRKETIVANDWMSIRMFDLDRDTFSARYIESIGNFTIFRVVDARTNVTVVGFHDNAFYWPGGKIAKRVHQLLWRRVVEARDLYKFRIVD